uniref:Uncharacterized protein n=1 Tax=Cucumis melo TaxID=3656 RepID=A0A9I9CK04_CUCME
MSRNQKQLSHGHGSRASSEWVTVRRSGGAIRVESFTRSRSSVASRRGSPSDVGRRRRSPSAVVVRCE